MSVAPFGSEKLNANVCDDPLLEFDVTDTGSGGAFTLPLMIPSDALVLCESAPLVPVTPMVNDPVPPLDDVFTVSVVDPVPVTVVGLKLAVAPDGSPEAPKLTTPLNPFNAVTVIA
jgi:hypothetical protein